MPECGQAPAAGSVSQVADALPGRPSPLGATAHDGGTNFAVASSVAEAAEVCLVDDAGQESRFRLPEYDGGAWHGFVRGRGECNDREHDHGDGVESEKEPEHGRTLGGE